MKASSSEGNNLQRTLKDGYESDSTLSYRRHQFVPQQSQNKSLYTQVQGHGASGAGAITVCIQVQKGGEVPTQGLRMQAPDKKGEKKYFRFRKNIISMTSSLQHAETETISVTCGDSGACLAPVILICCTCPVLVTCKCTGFTLWASPSHE